MSTAPSVTTSIVELVICVLRHAWAILAFKHPGAGLRLNLWQILWLGLAAVLVSMATPAFSPTDYASQSPAFVGAIVVGVFTSCYVFFGPTQAAGIIVLTLLTEPVSLVIRLVNLGCLDLPISSWTMVAISIFLFRTSGRQARAQ